ncbi:MAG: hypothetical protein CVV49_04475 [Spirochaetae bacterium HGW-Spirochaetae-5]|nr:MAG: hypothetical protein CVV49_04475 [Spirochaetae bacterium HGW-Spirochaetae-5]
MPEYLITDSRNGFKTLSIIDNKTGKEIKLHSSYDPVKEAERSIDAFEKGRSSIIAVSGIALGYHLIELKKKYPDTKIIAIENDTEITDLCRKISPASLESIQIIAPGTDPDIVFEGIDLSGFKGISHYIHKPSYQLNPEFYDKAMNAIKLHISSRISDLLTRFEFEEKWLQNIFRNLKHMENSDSVSKLFGKFRGLPGIIVSAGPSLKHSIEDLKKIRNKAVIVAVDTSLKILDKHNITPHFVLTLDAQKYSVKHFTGVKTDKTILIADMVSCPSIMNTFTGRKIISTTSKYYQNSQGDIVRETTPGIDWIEKKTGPLGDIQSGGSVATSAFDLLLNMGCDPIILTGQDLAYSGREYHCSGTYHNDDWIPRISRFSNLDTINQNVIRKRKIKYVRRYGNRNTIISDFVFDLYRSWFEDSAGRISASVINATGDGSKINNTKEMNLVDAVKTGTSKSDPQSIIDGIISVNTHNDIAEIRKSIIHEFQKIENLIDLTDSEEPDESTIEEINNLLEDDDTHSLLKPLMRRSQFYISRHTFETDKARDIIYNDVKMSVRKMKEILKGSGMME